MGALLLGGCDDIQIERIWLVDFAQPFPATRSDLTAFPPRHQGVYTAADSTESLCIGPTTVWQQDLHSLLRSRRELAGKGKGLRADSTYQQEGVLHYLHRVGRDSVRDSWLECDTIFNCAKPETGRLRRFQGHYYLNTSFDSTNNWLVQRLEISGRHLVWQRLGNDTLRLGVLAPGTVRLDRRAGHPAFFRLAPGSAAEVRRIGRYEGLWEPVREYDRRH
ncbi:hypothetical protein GCM10022409_49060 [Hymenobacter glaciei]|uniref:Uncharacterized protein n=2 Tax=Hymenobacter glaciei TaxID=877209 RepID=A0ABP7UZ54_9BACT